MINPEELRIGNLLIDDKTKKKVIVDAVTSETICLINPKDKSVYYVFRHYLSPIPLSPEILDKIEGFNRETKTTISKVYNDIGQVFTLNKVDGKYFLTWGDLEVKTLHQLQNVYYFFTGTELIINL